MSADQKQTRTRKELDKIQRIAKDDVKSVGGFASEAVKSGGYLYPIYGIIYLLRNPRLLNGVRPALYKSAMWSAITTVALFVVTYLPQVAVLALVTGPLCRRLRSILFRVLRRVPVLSKLTRTKGVQPKVLQNVAADSSSALLRHTLPRSVRRTAFIAAIPLVLAESYLVSSFLVRSMIMPGATEKIFDATLVQKGHSELVQQGRSLTKSGGQVTLGKSLLKPISKRFSTEGLWRYLITLPLNFIPGVGTAFFLFYNGQRAGPSYHARYFELKQLDKSERARFVQERKGAYTSFGAASIALGLIPVVGIATQFSSTVGAALLAADFEKKHGKTGPEDEAGGRDQVQVGMGRNDDL
ncbi:hypothetical protein OIV83_002865 [Microbotryomycetes sp. JL201]|nr:hypothetical protein OIV83_002865 [Microbotryomycetes sp. JL201]